MVNPLAEMFCPGCGRPLGDVVYEVDLFCSTECRKAYHDIGGCHRCGALYDHREGWQKAEYKWYLDVESFCPTCLKLFTEITKRLERIEKERVFWQNKLYNSPFPSIYKQDGNYYLGDNSFSFTEFKELIDKYEQEEVDKKLEQNKEIYGFIKALEDEKKYLYQLKQIRVKER